MRFSESYSDSWQARYGEPANASVDALSALTRHRSVRRYSDEPISEETVESLIFAAQSASTSSNLQLWTAISVQEPTSRKLRAEFCGNQAQVQEAPWFFAFIVDLHRLEVAARANGEDPAGLDYMEFALMGAIDAAIAAERMVCAAETLGLGTCYIGGLRNQPAAVAELLKLPTMTFGVFGLCLGYPAQDDVSAIKPRFDQNTVWHREVYQERPDLDQFLARMQAFYASQKMRGEANWAQRSGRRVDGNHMSGRDVLNDWLQSQGIAKR